MAEISQNRALEQLSCRDMMLRHDKKFAKQCSQNLSHVTILCCDMAETRFAFKPPCRVMSVHVAAAERLRKYGLKINSMSQYE